MRLRDRCVCTCVLMLCIAAGALADEAPHRMQPAGEPVVNAAHAARKAYQRQQFFWRQRAFPLGFIPGGANARAIQQRDQMQRVWLSQHAGAMSLQASAANATVLDGTWTELGPRPVTFPGYGDVSGRVTAIAMDPRNASIMYLGTATGGVWKSTDAGATWTPLTDAQPSLAIGAVAVIPASTAPSAPLVIYAGTGEGNFGFDNYYGVGILKSTDGGATWTNLPGPFAALTGYNTPREPSYWATAHISAVAIKPGDPNTVLAGAQFPTAANSGVFRSADGGLTWQRTLSGDAGVELIFSSADANVVYAALGHFGTSVAGVYRSNDAGQTWTRLVGSGANILPQTQVGRIALAATTNTTSTSTTLWAGIENSSTGALLGLYKSTDGGANWTKQTSAPNYCGPQCWYDNVIAISPTNTSVVYIGGAASAGLYRTTDGGATWTAANTSATGTVHVDHHALKFTPDGLTLFDGNDGGVWSTAQPGGTISWTNLNHTLGVIQFYPGLSVSPANARLAYGGAQDNGSEKYSGGAWSYTTCGDGGFTALDPLTPSTVYATCQNIAIRKSVDGGSTFTAVDGDVLASNDRTQFISPLTIDGVQPQNLYFGTYRVWQTRNGGGAWAAISGDLTAGTDYISTIAVAPGDSATVYAGTSNGRIAWTTNALGSVPQWIYAGTSGLPGRYLSSIKVDALSPSTVYAAYSGFKYGPDTLGHVFESVDHGASWVDISGDLPNTPVNDIAIDVDVANTIYVATDVGVFRTTNGGANWVSEGSGLPNVPVLSLVLHEATRTLIAATHGRGVWQLGTVPAVTTLAPSQLSFGNVTVATTTAAQTVTFTNGTPSAVTITSVQTSLADYRVTNSCPASIASAASCSLTVTFTPPSVGARSATLTLVSSASATPLTVALAGSGIPAISPKVSLSTTTLAFGSVAVGTTSAAKQVMLTNTGTGALTITSITATPSVFTVFHNCGTQVAAGASCVVNVSVRPVSAVAYAGTLSIASNDPSGVQNVSLTATGTAAVDGRHVINRKPVPAAPQKASGTARVGARVMLSDK